MLPDRGQGRYALVSMDDPFAIGDLLLSSTPVAVPLSLERTLPVYSMSRVIIVCDRYSAYKKLARLAANILLAFCWAHVRRDFLDVGRAFSELEPWALEWKERIGALYHLNKLTSGTVGSSNARLTEQSEAFDQHHEDPEEYLTTDAG